MENAVDEISGEYVGKLKGSSILEKGDLKLLFEWMGIKKAKLELIYKATEDGDSANAFWEKCENVGNTVTFVKSKLGKRFGGVRSVIFNKNKNDYQDDLKAFVFSLTYKCKFKQKEGYNKRYAVYDNSSRLPTWGGGHDLGLYTNCFTSNSSYTNLNHTYVYVNQEQGDTYQTVLAGAYNFLCEEVEVFKYTVK